MDRKLNIFLFSIGIFASFLPVVITVILTSVILNPTHKDTSLNPEEQFKLCSNWNFTVSPSKNNITAYLYFPEKPKKAPKKRVTTEFYNGFSKPGYFSFNGNKGDIVEVSYNNSVYSKINIYYIKYHQGSEDTLSWSESKYIFKINGTGLLYGNVTLPKKDKYYIYVYYVGNNFYEMNITYWRDYYILSNKSIECPINVNTTFNDKGEKGYCVVLETKYNKTLINPSKNTVYVYYKVRYSSEDIMAIILVCVLTGFLPIIIIIIFVRHCCYLFDKIDYDDHKKNCCVSCCCCCCIIKRNRQAKRERIERGDEKKTRKEEMEFNLLADVQ